MIRFHLKLLFVSLLLVLGFIASPAQARKPEQNAGQWPPFFFNVTFSHEDNLVIYKLLFRQERGLQLNDLAVKVPIPSGARFVKADVPSNSTSDFDGEEVSFFTNTLRRSWQISFTVEITEPSQTVFETQAWFSWIGDKPGTFLLENIEVDITREPLAWQRPGRSRLQLEAMTTSKDNLVTYYLYPKNNNPLRMWDLKVTLPIPNGAKFVSVKAPPEFTAGFDGQSAVFTIIEMPGYTVFEPLQVTVSASEALTVPLFTEAKAFWKNTGRKVGLTIPAEESVKTGYLISPPLANQALVADPVGDAAFPFYDLSAVAIEQEEEVLKVAFYTSEPVGKMDQPLHYQLMLDQDCSAQSGRAQGQERGWDYRLMYKHEQGKATLDTWTAAQQKWTSQGPLQVEAATEAPTIKISIPVEMLSEFTRLCWRAIASYETDSYYPNPPRDVVPNFPGDFWLTQYLAITGTTTTTNSTTTK
jgi:hypothetical protein